MKRAFTILELVFVIVILGILAAIALPKFSSSRDEAEVSKSLNNLKTLINDISIYTLKNDHLSSIKTMSNVSGVENVDLSNFNGIKEVNFRVGDEKE
ncbi:type II secretion system protein, partial [Campylobacter coli]